MVWWLSLAQAVAMDGFRLRRDGRQRLLEMEAGVLATEAAGLELGGDWFSCGWVRAVRDSGWAVGDGGN